jgi:3-hydroxyacyl-CoA dehydrogenase
MDMMLLVVEAEKTSREVVKQAGALMAQSKANVSIVLNKTRNYVPARLHQEF